MKKNMVKGLMIGAAAGCVMGAMMDNMSGARGKALCKMGRGVAKKCGNWVSGLFG